MVAGHQPPPPGAMTSFSCRACHARIFDEWAGSSHARAFDSPVFQQKYQARGRPESCRQCHTPESIWETPPGELPRPRRHHLAEGVSCMACHQHGDAQVGPHRTPDAAHPTIEDASLRGVGMCASCHDRPCECNSLELGAQGQLHDYLHAPQRARETCQSCHMPKVFDTSVSLVRPTYPERDGRSHRIEASRDPEVLRLAVRMDGILEDRYFLLSLENAASGHKLPGGPERALITITRFTDRRGMELDRVHEYVHARTRTRLRAGEHREYRYLLKPHYEGVETKLYYRLFEGQPFADWVVVDRIALRLDGRGALPEAPSDGPGRRSMMPKHQQVPTTSRVH